MGNLQSVEPTHVTRCAGRNEHVPGRELTGRSFKVQQMFLRLKHHSMFGFFINFNLGMIWSHVALGASRGQTRELYRCRVARVARSASANRAIVVWSSDAVTLFTATDHCRAALERGERMRRASLHASRLISFGKRDLLRLESLFPIHRSPGNRGMTTAKEFLIDALVTTPAVP